MIRFARALVVALVAVFAAWSVAQVAIATTMTLEMAVADGQDMTMPACEGCGSGGTDDRAGLACDAACASPVLADLAATQGPNPVPMVPHPGWSAHDAAGWTCPPEPHPPRAPLPI